MRIFLCVVWLMLPVGVAAYHYGPGQERLRLDDASALLGEADRYAAEKQWAEAVAKYDEALRQLPPERIREARAIRLERAKVQMLAKQLPAARGELETLVDELNEDPKADRALLAEARATLANSQYYMTWLMRLEGLAADEWEPEIEASRQTFRLLAEEAAAKGDEKMAAKHKQDLESAIRLARLDLAELQGLPLPSQ